MARICILGGGLVGRFVACTLLERNHDVRLIDGETVSHLPDKMEFIQTYINPHSVSELITGCDVVVNCLPGRIGHAIRQPLLSIEGISVADLAFTAEDPREFDELAKKTGSRLIYDIGIAPGLSNALLMAAQHRIPPLTSAKIWVGGNPQKPDGEWSYMAPFSPSDVIEEYTRPARFRREGLLLTEPALSERHMVEVPGYGNMEAFLTDGARSLLDTIHSDELVEYTVRWPGHIQKYLDGNYTEEELIDAWKFDDSCPEFTWLAVVVCNEQKSIRWDIIDEGKDGWSSMARATGLVTVEVTQILLEGLIQEYGVLPPEYLGEDSELLNRLLNTMRNEGVQINENTTISS